MEKVSYTPVSMKAVPSRRHYFSHTAAPKSRQLYWISAALGVICMLLLILSAHKFINGSVFKIPMIASVTEFLGLDLSENVEETVEKARDNVDLTLDVLELICKNSDFLAEIEEQLNLPFEEWEATYGILPAEFRNLFNPLSLSHLTTLLSLFLGEDHISVSILRTLIGVVIGATVCLVVLALLASIFRKTWLSIFTCIFSAGFFSVTGGIVYWLLGCGSLIAMSVICYRLTKEYKQYRQSILTAPST